MANVSFYKQDAGATAKGAITFRTNGGVTVGTGSAATEYASKVSFSRSLTSGTKIGTLTINGTSTDLYCQTNTDTKVSTAKTSSVYYLTGQTSSSATTGTLVFRTDAYVDTSGYLYSCGAKTIVYKGSWATTVEGTPSGTSANALGRCTTKVYLPNGYVPMGKITLSVTKQSGGTDSTADGQLGMTTTGTDTGRYFATITLTGRTGTACNDEGNYPAPSVTANVLFTGYFAYYN